MRVPGSNRLRNADSFRQTANVLRLTRAGVAWQAVGCARGAYEHALAYARQAGLRAAGHPRLRLLLCRETLSPNRVCAAEPLAGAVRADQNFG